MIQTFDYLEFDADGNVAGLIELAIDLPDEMPVFDRG